MFNIIDLKKHYGLSDSELEHTLNCYIPENIKANTYFLKQGFVSDKIGFVKNGLLRAFFYNDDADEITTQFYPTGSLIISLDSYHNQTPSKEIIIAVDNAEIMAISYQKQKELYQKIPQWSQICKEMSDYKSKEMIERAIQFQTLSATGRYKLFCTQFPEVIQKVALRHIDSYLGIDIATLSRFRMKR